MKIKLCHRKYSLLEQYFFILIAVYKKLPADAGSISARRERWYELCAGRPEIDGAFHPERVGSVIRTIAEVLHPFQIECAAGRYGNARDA